MTRVGLLAFAAVFFLSGNALAQKTYKWTDEEGQKHYSNAPGQGARAATEAAPAAPAASGDETESEYSNLSNESLSSVVSRKRSKLRRDLRAVKKDLRELDREAAQLKRERQNALKKYGGQLQGVSAAPVGVESEQDKELKERREALLAKERSIRESYDKLKNETVKRHGSQPSWWLPLD